MSHMIFAFLAVVTLIVPLAFAGPYVPPNFDHKSAKSPHVDIPIPPVPVGRWNVEFANGVKEVCEVRNDGTGSVTEPSRTSTGKFEAKGNSAIIVYQDDRVERWTPVGKRAVVEHWFPASQYPCGKPVMGIADLERSPKALH